jgi:transcriptional regulator with XRE-family HTH domain
MPKVFLSYAPIDRDSIERDVLPKIGFNSIWVSVDESRLGQESASDVIEDALEMCESFLLIVSYNACNSSLVKLEVSAALDRGIPILLVGIDSSSPIFIHSSLDLIPYIDFRSASARDIEVIRSFLSNKKTTIEQRSSKSIYVDSEKIKYLRLKSGLTLEELASKVGASRRAMMRLESGGRTSNRTVLNELARALGVFPSELEKSSIPIPKLTEEVATLFFDMEDIDSQLRPSANDDQTTALLAQIEESRPDPLISVFFDDSSFTEDDIDLFLTYLSETYRELGGLGLKVVGGKTLTPEPAEVEL